MTAFDPGSLLPMVTVCVCTVDAPQRLRRLLGSLALQTYPLERMLVVVVDGSDHRLANPASVRTHSQLTIRYVAEPNSYGAQARNTAAALALGDWVAFIDDQYEPASTWLEEMVRTAAGASVAVVLGPKIALFPADTAAWVVRSRFFEKRRFKTSAPVSSDYGRASNALIATAWLHARPGSPFEPSGAGHDLEGHDFFLWVEKNEGRIVWCDEAAVSTVVPPSRHSLKYMLTRSLRTSSAYWQNINRHRSRLLAWLEAVRGVAGAFGAALAGALMLPRGVQAAAPYWVKMAKGLGRAAALAGFEMRRH